MTKKHVILVFEKIPMDRNFENFLKGGCVMEALMFVIGVLSGCIITVVIFRVKSVGSLQIYTSDPDENPYLFLELSKDVGEVYRKKYVTLKVNIKNFIPHK